MVHFGPSLGVGSTLYVHSFNEGELKVVFNIFSIIMVTLRLYNCIHR